MMQFHPSAEQVAIQDSVRGTLASTLPPSRLHQLIDSQAELDAESWNALMTLGLGGLLLPEELGGSGLGLVEAALAVEALGEGAATGPVIPHLMTAYALSLCSDEAVRRRWGPGLASGEVLATIAFGGGWLPDAWDVTERKGKISGAVRFVQAAGSARLFLVGLQHGRLALVEAGEGIAITPIASVDRSRRLSSVTFTNAPAVVLEADAVRVFNAGLVFLAADALGGAQKATDMSVAYAREREQFGQPIGRFQALKHQLATMALEAESSRAFVWYAAYALNRNLAEAARSAAIAKAHLADRFVSVTRAAVAAHGGIGYTWEYDLSIWVRRSFFNRAYLGSPLLHRTRAAALAGW